MLMLRGETVAGGLQLLTVYVFQRDAIHFSFESGCQFSPLRLVYMPVPTKTRLDAGGLPLLNAVFCLDCEVISNSHGDECPVCKGRSLVNLARVLGGSLFAHREHQSQECEARLFHTTITVELQQMDAKDLTVTLERLTTVIAPKLARDEATFRITVNPSANAVKSQGLLSFPDRDAA